MSLTYVWQMMNPQDGTRSLPMQGTVEQLGEFLGMAKSRADAEYEKDLEVDPEAEYNDHYFLMLFEDNGEEEQENFISRMPIMRLSLMCEYFKESLAQSSTKIGEHPV